MARASRIPRCLVGHCVCTCPLTRRSLLAGSTGVVTTAAVARFEPAAAGQSRSETFTGTFTGVGTPDWHYLPVEVPRGVREIEVSYAYEKTDTGLGFSANVIDIGIFDASGKDLGDAVGPAAGPAVGREVVEPLGEAVADRDVAPVLCVRLLVHRHGPLSSRSSACPVRCSPQRCPVLRR